MPDRSIADFTGFPEIMDGRVKTLHPSSTPACSPCAASPSHLAAAAEHDVEWVDLVS